MAADAPRVIGIALQWCLRDGVSNHQRLHCLINCWFRRRAKKTSKLHISGLWRGIKRWPVNAPHKRPVTRKCFHLMTSSWNLSTGQTGLTRSSTRNFANNTSTIWMMRYDRQCNCVFVFINKFGTARVIQNMHVAEIAQREVPQNSRTKLHVISSSILVPCIWHQSPGHQLSW